MATRDFITAQELREKFSYNPETGLFFRKWKTNRATRTGPAGCPKFEDGYLEIGINRSKYLAHRLAWLYMHGAWPTGYIDHINGVKNDNRIGNLRDVSHMENMQNRIKPRGYVGKFRDRYRAQFQVHNKKVTKIFMTEELGREWISAAIQASA